MRPDAVTAARGLTYRVAACGCIRCACRNRLRHRECFLTLILNRTLETVLHPAGMPPACAGSPPRLESGGTSAARDLELTE